MVLELFGSVCGGGGVCGGGEEFLSHSPLKFSKLITDFHTGIQEKTFGGATYLVYVNAVLGSFGAPSYFLKMMYHNTSSFNCYLSLNPVK